MIVLGIDPALNTTGYAIVEKAKNGTMGLVNSGIIKNKQTDEFPAKLLHLFDEISHICSIYQPVLCGIEETFLNVNPTSSIKLGAARGALIAAIAKNGIPIFEYSANRIKKTVTGAGKADKTQVEFMVQRLISGVGNNLSSDEYDAIAIALTCICFEGR